MTQSRLKQCSSLLRKFVGTVEYVQVPLVVELLMEDFIFQKRNYFSQPLSHGETDIPVAPGGPLMYYA